MDPTTRLQNAIAFELRLAIDRLSKVSGQAARHLGVEIAANQLSRVAATCTLQLRPPVQRVVYRLGGTSERSHARGTKWIPSFSQISRDFCSFLSWAS